MLTQKNAAAVLFSQEVNTSKPKLEKQDSKIYVLSSADSLIAEALTPNQTQRVHALVASWSVQDQEQLVNEICYCLLNPAQFTGCGKDFSKKLNAIRAVILRGDWQTPAGMVEKETQEKTEKQSYLEQSLHAARAEEMHFKRLLDLAHENAKEGLRGLVYKAQQRVVDIESLIKQSPQNDILEWNLK
jgi:hypothetical protein